MCYLLQEANFFLTLSYFKNILGCFNLSSIICLVFLWSPLLGFMVKLKIEKAILHNLKNRYSYIVFIERVQKNGVIIWGTLFIRTTFYKNSQPQIWYFEIGILENIHARCKLIRKTKREDHKKHFKHIIQGGSRLNWSKLSSKIRTTEPQPKITGSNKKKV